MVIKLLIKLKVAHYISLLSIDEQQLEIQLMFFVCCWPMTRADRRKQRKTGRGWIILFKKKREKEKKISIKYSHSQIIIR